MNIQNDEHSDSSIQTKGKRKLKVLTNTAFLPALLTLMNGLCGLGCIHFATKYGLHTKLYSLSSNTVELDNDLINAFWMAAVLLFAAMLFDMFDGRVARMTRSTSDFGAQLDSLCDAISFGVAPAILVLRCSIAILKSTDIGNLLDGPTIEKIFWGISAIYVSCAVLRLARFNVETDESEESHMTFKGLPTPGAAACMSMITLLYLHLLTTESINWETFVIPLNTFNIISVISLPVLLLVTGLLMISRVVYVHFGNQYIKGNKPIGNLIKSVCIISLVVLFPYITLSLLAFLYISSGPLNYLFSILKGTPVSDEDS